MSALRRANAPIIHPPAGRVLPAHIAATAKRLAAQPTGAKPPVVPWDNPTEDDIRRAHFEEAVRLLVDETSSPPDPVVVEYARRRGIITTWELNFLNSVAGRRDLSIRQDICIARINRKILREMGVPDASR